MIEAFWAQEIAGAGYDYFDDISKNNKPWAMLNPEQQGQLVQDAYQFGYFNSPKQWNDPNRPNQADKIILIQAFDKVLPQLRQGHGAT
jgi:hypothetical protein